MADYQDTPLSIAPGIFKDSSGHAARGRYIDGTNVRFWKGFPERIGGWLALTASASTYPARGAIAFKTLPPSAQYMAYGTANKLHLMRSGTIYDITPTTSFTAGSANSSTTYGWGAGAWGTTAWGGIETIYTAVNHALTWTLGNWGEDLVACPRGQGIFLWDASVGTGTAASRITASPPIAYGVFVSDVDRTLVAYGAHNGYQSVVTADAGADTITWTAHGHSAGDSGQFTTTNTLPGGLSLATTYYIINPTTNTFQVSLTAGGAAVNITTTGMGTHTFTTGSADPLNIRWSNSEDYNTWRASATNTAGSLRCEVGNEVVGAMSARGGHLICTDQATYYFHYVGGDYVYALNKISDGPTMISPHAGVQDAAGNTYWMGPKTFYVYDGTVSNLPCDVHADIFDNINIAQRFKVYCGTIRAFNEIIWFYPRDGSTEINACVGYNTVEKTWWQGDVARSSWVDASVVVDYPVGFGTDGYLYAHENGSNGNGSAISYSLETSDLSMGEGSYLRGRKLIPDFDRISGTTHTVEIDVRGYPLRTPTTIGPYSIDTTTSQLSVRARGREIRLRFEGSDDFRHGQWQVRTRVDGRQE